MATSGIITNIQRCSTEDGPGIRTTLFFKGCPMKCLWCHNIETIDPKRIVVWYAVKCIGDQACVRACPESAIEMTPNGVRIDHERCTLCGDCEDACPTGAIKMMGQVWASDDMVNELLKDKIFFNTSGGGVTLSGGEATFQADFAIKVAKGLQENGVHVALDTCGYCSESVMRSLLRHVDLVLYDLKTMDPKMHQEYTGVPLDRVLENARVVAESGLPTWIRTPIIPKHTDDEKNVRSISRFILDNMPNVERYDLLAFNKMCVDKYHLFGLEYPLEDEDLMESEAMEHLAQVARDVGVQNVVWSGMTKRDGSGPVDSTERVVNCG